MTTIRSYEDRDYAGIDTLWNACFPDAPPRNRAAASVPAKLAVDDQLLIVAEMEGRIVGSVMAGYDGHRGWLYAIAVDPAHRRGRIGEALVREAEQRLARAGCVKINLQVRAENAAVARFYHHCGYGVEDRISMARLLAPEAA